MSKPEPMDADLHLGTMAAEEIRRLRQRIRGLEAEIADRPSPAPPREPTREMRRAGVANMGLMLSDDEARIRAIWQAMYDASPPRAAGADEQEGAWWAAARSALGEFNDKELSVIECIRDAVKAATDNMDAAMRPNVSIDTMVDRFLNWPLPKTFAPDCGISFDGRKDDEWNKNKTWPIGTNLFTADEARQMFEHALSQSQSAPPAQAHGQLIGCARHGYWDCSICNDGSAAMRASGREGEK